MVAVQMRERTLRFGLETRVQCSIQRLVVSREVGFEKEIGVEKVVENVA